MSWLHFGPATLYFFGTTFAFGFSNMVPNREPYHVMNAVVLIFYSGTGFPVACSVTKNTDTGGKNLTSCCRLNEIVSSTFTYPLRT